MPGPAQPHHPAARCAACEAELPPTGSSRPALYCSNACRQRAYRRRAAQPDLSTENTPAGEADTELPEPLDSFVGRAEELDLLKTAMQTSRLVTLVGTGGVGKTRLAVEVARRPAGGRRRRIRLVELGAVGDPSALLNAVADALGMSGAMDQPTPASIAQVINTEQLSLLVDNCEHLLEPCTALVSELLRSCPGMRVLATSREPLYVPCEAVVWVEPMPVVDVGSGVPRERLLACDAVRLFVDRAKAADSDFDLGDGTLEEVARLCCDLDGLPLGIELAARRVRAMPVGEIARCLDDQLTLLRQRTSTPRHSDLHAMIDWSYRLLAEPEQIVLRRLSLLAGGFDRGTATAVAAGGPITQQDVLPIVLSLHTKSLLQRSDAPDGTMSFRMLSAIQLYAADRLRESGEEPEIVTRCVGSLLEQAAPLATRIWIGTARRLKINVPNLVSALRAVPATPDHADTRLLLAAAAARAWQVIGKPGAGRLLLTTVLAECPDSVNRPIALVSLAGIAVHQGRYEEALRHSAEAVIGARRLGHATVHIRALEQLALALYAVGRYATCEQICRQMVTKAVRCGGSALDIALSKQNLAWFLLSEGSVDEARALLDEALPVIRDQAESPNLHASALHTSATAHLMLGHHGQARTELLDSLRIAFDDAIIRPYLLEGLAVVAHELDADPFRATMLLTAATTSRKRLEQQPLPVWGSWISRYLERIRTALPASEFAAAQRRGAQTTADEILTLLLGGPGDTAESLLTAKEREVIALVADGCSNKQVARRLGISGRTVTNHLDNVKRKLRFDTRDQIVRWSIEGGR